MISVHPLINHYNDTGDGTARKLSDFLSQRRYHESVLYRELFCRLNVEHMMAFYLPERPPNSIAIALIRDRRDFTECDRLMLNLLRPHLFRAYHNAELITQLREQAAFGEQALEATRQGVILLDAQGRTKFCSTNARAWLAAYFSPAKRAANGKLPEEIQQWVRQQSLPPVKREKIPSPRQPLTVERNGRRLVARLVADSIPGQQVLVLEERQTILSPEPLRRLGLTAREAEVLLWATQGKTSPEIGQILVCSTATVNKHLEHVFIKLGVETRTAAALRAFEVLTGATSGASSLE